MPEVIVRKGESIDRAIKRLKSKLDSEGIMDEVRRLRAFETPTQKTRRKAKANAKWGTSVNDVARKKLHELADVPNDVVDAKEKIICI